MVDLSFTSMDQEVENVNPAAGGIILDNSIMIAPSAVIYQGMFSLCLKIFPSFGKIH